MKEHPILFSGAMVRALLDRSKTQTRRMMKPQPKQEENGFWSAFGAMWTDGIKSVPVVPGHSLACNCPYGAPGEHIWLRETFYAYGRWETRYSEKKKRDEWHFIDMTVECGRAYQYAADNPDVPLTTGRGGALPGWYKRPSIFMPRAVSRIQLVITKVRVERLQVIWANEVDCIAEGIEQIPPAIQGACLWRNYMPNNGWTRSVAIPGNSYRTLWESINGEENWLANPWVWVIEFQRVPP
ncbi:hypothetical protein [Undibacterium sp. TJN19]|uniref:hypothetical protein n=1 Tax=Undibacterium sp. TJN19 TaxID=3413055 RepID=UPI003BF2A00F